MRFKEGKCSKCKETSHAKYMRGDGFGQYKDAYVSDAGNLSEAATST